MTSVHELVKYKNGKKLWHKNKTTLHTVSYNEESSTFKVNHSAVRSADYAAPSIARERFAWQLLICLLVNKEPKIRLLVMSSSGTKS